MKKLIALLTLLLSACINPAIAGPYLTFGSGYNDIDFPRITLVTPLITANDAAPTISVVDGANVMRTSSKRMFASLAWGYLFPISQHFQTGVETGYTYYGQLKIENLPGPLFPLGGFASGAIKLGLHGFSLLATEEVDWSRFFIQGKLGPVMLVTLANSTYSFDNRGGIPFFNKSVKDGIQISALLGLNIGYYLTQHFNIAFQYQHIFGSQYNDAQLNQPGNYPARNTFPAPSMNLFGLVATWFV